MIDKEKLTLSAGNQALWRITMKVIRRRRSYVMVELPHTAFSCLQCLVSPFTTLSTVRTNQPPVVEELNQPLCDMVIVIQDQDLVVPNIL